MAVGTLKCGWCDQVLSFQVLFNFNDLRNEWLPAGQQVSPPGSEASGVCWVQGHLPEAFVGPCAFCGCGLLFRVMIPFLAPGCWREATFSWQCPQEMGVGSREPHAPGPGHTREEEAGGWVSQPLCGLLVFWCSLFPVTAGAPGRPQGVRRLRASPRCGGTARSFPPSDLLQMQLVSRVTAG